MGLQGLPISKRNSKRIRNFGKRKNRIDKKEYEISGKIETVKDLLTEFVTINVKE